MGGGTWVCGWSNAWNKVRRREGGLFNVGEVVAGLDTTISKRFSIDRIRMG